MLCFGAGWARGGAELTGAPRATPLTLHVSPPRGCGDCPSLSTPLFQVFCMNLITQSPSDCVRVLVPQLRRGGSWDVPWGSLGPAPSVQQGRRHRRPFGGFCPIRAASAPGGLRGLPPFWKAAGGLCGESVVGAWKRRQRRAQGRASQCLRVPCCDHRPPGERHRVNFCERLVRPQGSVRHRGPKVAQGLPSFSRFPALGVAWPHYLPKCRPSRKHPSSPRPIVTPTACVHVSTISFPDRITIRSRSLLPTSELWSLHCAPQTLTE